AGEPGGDRGEARRWQPRWFHAAGARDALEEIVVAEVLAAEDVAASALPALPGGDRAARDVTHVDEAVLAGGIDRNLAFDQVNDHPPRRRSHIARADHETGIDDDGGDA